MAGKKSSGRKNWRTEKGKLVETNRKSVELLPKHMRELPADMVTKEEADENRIHELDAPHIVDALIEERQKRDAAEEAGVSNRLKDQVPGLGEAELQAEIPLTQERVDMVRMRAIWGLIQGAYTLMEVEGQPGVLLDWDDHLAPKHLWFPKDSIQDYFLREGNPPADADRPKHLKRLDLWVDPCNVPESIITRLSVMGILTEDLRMLTAELRNRLREAAAAKAMGRAIAESEDSNVVH